MSGPYEAQGNPNHPGVKGQPYNQPEVEGVNAPIKVDNPGTGTFPPHQQGFEGQSQPAGLSATTQYGEQGGLPVSHLPEEAEGELKPVEGEPEGKDGDE